MDWLSLTVFVFHKKQRISVSIETFLKLSVFEYPEFLTSFINIFIFTNCTLVGISKQRCSKPSVVLILFKYLTSISSSVISLPAFPISFDWGKSVVEETSENKVKDSLC